MGVGVINYHETDELAPLLAYAEIYGTCTLSCLGNDTQFNYKLRHILVCNYEENKTKAKSNFLIETGPSIHKGSEEATRVWQRRGAAARSSRLLGTGIPETGILCCALYSPHREAAEWGPMFEEAHMCPPQLSAERRLRHRGSFFLFDRIDAESTAAALLVLEM
ncbi:hypothetical protein KM043_010372 [Ampulex compressa]|nr:hypothetical protein KM043_010372 [Ampulex compressa]